ncbi:TPA: hypothetical protein DEG21_05900 [Patescibacteria group bacterium]|nr:hypothetical protein [Candidatus Gracilibacteria bacterium]HBY75342.1 hypothetical protein [Candidatus Gracilibacteria bacterium]
MIAVVSSIGKRVDLSSAIFRSSFSSGVRVFLLFNSIRFHHIEELRVFQFLIFSRIFSYSLA